MYQVTRWMIAGWLIESEGEVTIKEIIERCPESSTEEIICGIKEYFKGLSE